MYVNISELTKKNAQIVHRKRSTKKGVQITTLGFGAFKCREGICRVGDLRFKKKNISEVEDLGTYNKIYIFKAKGGD